MVSASKIAKYFLAHSCDREEGDLISNLKLQKLLYYAQGFSVALLGHPLFAERIEAWTHGPVVPSVYREYSHYGAGAIPEPSDFDLDNYDEETKALLDEVYSVYGQYSAWKLANMTHVEPPWKDAYRRGPSSEISLDSLRDYFSTLVEA
jgi:uncharacterized phage-associated protein